MGRTLDMTFDEWVIENYDRGQLEDIVDHGALQGVPGLTYTNETYACYEAFEEDLWHHLCMMAEMHRVEPVQLLVGSFGVIICNDSGLRTSLVWLVFEYVAQLILDNGKARESVDEPTTEDRVNSKLGALAAALQRQVDERTNA